MSNDINAVVHAARRWIGTPWRHRGRQIGRACDCVGLVIGTAQELGLGDYRKPYNRQPDPSAMLAELEAYLDPIRVADAQPGDILYLAFRGVPTHLAIISAPGRVVHAYEPAGRVVEHSIDARWKRRIVGAYRFRRTH
jgi:NlpC/P60 family putative phage cell wall peptidase